MGWVLVRVIEEMGGEGRGMVDCGLNRKEDLYRNMSRVEMLVFIMGVASVIDAW